MECVVAECPSSLANTLCEDGRDILDIIATIIATIILYTLWRIKFHVKICTSSGLTAATSAACDYLSDLRGQSGIGSEGVQIVHPSVEGASLLLCNAVLLASSIGLLSLLNPA